MLLQPANLIVPSAGKVAFFGGGGSGKSLTSIMLAIGLSKTLHKSKAIAFVDPEGVAEFVKPICDVENVPLFIVPTRTFVEMRDALTEAEQADCCVFVVDHYDGIFRELAEAQKAKLNLDGRNLPYHHREELIRVWEAWVRQFRSSPLHTIFNGRLGWDWGDDEDEAGDPIKVKLGTKMRGESDAGYEPNLLIEMEKIQDLTKRQRKTRSKTGTITHFAHVLKDRRMVLNGLSFAWKDLNGYQAGDYQTVWKALGPHFLPASVTPSAGLTASLRPTPRSSAELFRPVSGESAFAERERRITIAIEEIQATFRTIWPGESHDEKKLRLIVLQTLFKSRSWKHIEGLLPEVVETAWKVMQHFEAAAQDINVKDEASVIALIASCKELEKAGAF